MSSNGDASVAGSTNLIETIGVTKTVTTSDDGEGNTVTDTRQIVGHDEDINTLDPFTGESTFTLTPPADGSYSVSVSIESYYVFDNNDGCATANSFCERMIAGADAEDEFGGNNFAASVYGSATTSTILHFRLLPDAPVVNDKQKMRMKVTIWMVLATDMGTCWRRHHFTSVHRRICFGGRGYTCLHPLHHRFMTGMLHSP